MPTRTRRDLLHCACAAIAKAWSCRSAGPGVWRLAAGAPPLFAAPAATSAQPHARFAALAFEMRRRAIASGDQPYGAVVVRADQVIGEGVSAVLTSGDARAHAEIVAMRAAIRHLGHDDLSGCLLYGSARACPMCEAFAHRAGIARMYYGERGEDAGPPRGPA